MALLHAEPRRVGPAGEGPDLGDAREGVDVEAGLRVVVEGLHGHVARRPHQRGLGNCRGLLARHHPEQRQDALVAESGVVEVLDQHPVATPRREVRVPVVPNP